MTKSIYKQHLPLSGPASFKVALSAKPLFVGAQADRPTLWYLDNLGEDDMRVRTYSAMTGEELPDKFLETHTYIGSAITMGGAFLTHVFIENEWANKSKGA